MQAEYRRDLPHDTVILQLGDLRTLEGVRTEWVANNVLLRPGFESFNKLIIDTLLNIDPRSSTAALAVVEENTKIDPRNSVLNIRIVKHNIWALATKLQRNLLQIRTSSRFHDLSANNGRSSESNLVDVHVGRESSSCHLAEARNDVDDTGWETSFFNELGGVESAEGGLLSGFENNNIATGDGRANLPSEHEEREVPGDDLAADTNLDRLLSASGPSKDRIGGTNRLLLGVIEILRNRLNYFAMDFVCPTAVISEASGAHSDINLGHAERFAIV